MFSPAAFSTRVFAAASFLAIGGCAESVGVETPERGGAQADSSTVAERPDGSSDARDGSSNAEGGDTDGASTDGATTDGSVADQGGTDALTDGENPPCQTPPGACLGMLPQGWELILFRANRDAECPQDFAQADVIAEPVAGAGACDCSCSVGPAPSCTTGQMSTRHGTTSACSSTGASINVSGSGCTPLAGNLSTYFSATPLPASVTCSASPVTDESKLSFSPGRTCRVADECREEVCNGAAPPGFSACLALDGQVSCPPGWGTRTLVGESASLSCSSCTCQASATCSAGRIDFYSDSSCNNLRIAFDVNDTCQATNGGGSIAAFAYSATVGGAQCTANGPRTASVELAAPRTVCCK